MSKSSTMLLCLCFCVAISSSSVHAAEHYQSIMSVQCVSPASSSTLQDSCPLTEKLNKPMDVDFDSHKLQTALTFWQENTNLNLQVDWTGLINIGVEPNLPITLKIKNAPAGVVLEMILEQASAINELDPIMYQVNQGLIQIATKRHFLKRPKVVVYDLTQLLKTNTPKPILKTDEAKATESESGDSRKIVSAWAPNGCSQDQNNGFGAPYMETKLSELQTLIQTQIEPKAWIEDGGDFASISHFNDKLIVRAPQFMQQQIVELLHALANPPKHDLYAPNARRLEPRRRLTLPTEQSEKAKHDN